MTLDALRAELAALALAYPGETPVCVQVAGNVNPLIRVEAESEEGVRVILNG